MPTLLLKVDVDTERGTRIGVPRLLNLFQELQIPATFFFALGKDNTGRAIKRIFRKGFFSKVSRTSVVSTYGLRTLLNGVLWPGPHIGKCHAALLRKVKDAGFEVGIHCYDHVKWQDGVTNMPEVKIAQEFAKALQAFKDVFSKDAEAAAAPGWQANAKTLQVYDNANLLYGSDTRGCEPFLPKVNGKVFQTLQIPTTLPTLDELLGRDAFPLERLILYYISLLRDDVPNVMTIHAELEGMRYFNWFREFLLVAQKCQVELQNLKTLAASCLQHRATLPICEVIQGEVDGRSGKLAVQGEGTSL